MFHVPPSLDFKSPSTLLATWFGCGLMRPAPGTWGSIGAMPFGIFILVYGSPVLLALSAIILFCIGIWATKKVLAGSGDDSDPQIVVIDEVVGQWIALIPAALSPVSLVLALILFRVFDILKPWPVSYFDRKIGGAWGVMLDDAAAGGIAALCLWALQYWWL